jgi:biopolymer transport protein ExbD
MKFPRNARLLRSQLDAAPFVSVFFLLVIFLMLGALLPTPGRPLRLPQADDVPGTDKPVVSVAIDALGRLYFENQGIEESELRNRLLKAVSGSAEPPTLVVLPDQAVTYEQLMRLMLLAGAAGIQDVRLATLPRIITATPARAPEQP